MPNSGERARESGENSYIGFIWVSRGAIGPHKDRGIPSQCEWAQRSNSALRPAIDDFARVFIEK